jgi:hypothetical protein
MTLQCIRLADHVTLNFNDNIDGCCFSVMMADSRYMVNRKQSSSPPQPKLNHLNAEISEFPSLSTRGRKKKKTLKKEAKEIFHHVVS